MLMPTDIINHTVNNSTTSSIIGEHRHRLIHLIITLLLLPLLLLVKDSHHRHLPLLRVLLLLLMGTPLATLRLNNIPPLTLPLPHLGNNLIILLLGLLLGLNSASHHLPAAVLLIMVIPIITTMEVIPTIRRPNNSVPTQLLLLPLGKENHPKQELRPLLITTTLSHLHPPCIHRILPACRLPPSILRIIPTTLRPTTSNACPTITPLLRQVMEDPLP
mmetsp:Transcript_21733/g.45391  ORF Transcript_21733/g.45391 Transcript_21733/m.45391 type:complete len:218 (+) Transcript_21733:552-1205(+)